MADLIDRDAAHDAIGVERCDRSCTDCPTKCTWFYTVNNIPAANRWIPCSEKRPDCFGEYLTYNAETGGMYVLSFSPEYNTFGIYDNEITHWMPLPEPPERKENSDE